MPVLAKLLIFFITTIHIEVQSFENKRYNFCDIYESVQNNTIKLKDALRGLNLTAAIPVEPNQSYVSKRILDLVSTFASFNVEYTNGGIPFEDESWTDVLQRNAGTHDIACDWWSRTVDRLSLGFTFPQGYYDSSTLMIKKKANDSASAKFWAFSMPFSPDLWLLTVFMITITGVVYYFLDYLESKARKDSMDTDFIGSIFFSFHAFTGHCNYETKSGASKLLSTSMCFLYIILVSAYTANLANFFILKRIPEVMINNLDDVIENNLPLCLLRGYPSSIFVQENYPNANVFLTESSEEALIAVSEGKCKVALVSAEIWYTFEYDKRYNKDCDLEWIGRRVDTTIGGFAIKDSRTLCSALLDNALNLYIIELTSDGTIEKMLESYRMETTIAGCDSKDKRDTSKVRTVQLNIQNMGGAFAFHIFFVAFSIILALFEFYRQPEETKSRVERDFRSSLQEAMKSSRSSLFDLNSKENNFQNDICIDEALANTAKKKPVIVNQDLQKKIIAEKVEHVEGLVWRNNTSTTRKLQNIITLFENNYQKQEEELILIKEEIKSIEQKDS